MDPCASEDPRLMSQMKSEGRGDAPQLRAFPMFTSLTFSMDQTSYLSKRYLQKTCTVGFTGIMLH